MKLGLVTYNLAKSWDVPTIIKNCAETGFDGVEIRTTHAHGVELALPPNARAEVKRRFADSPVALVSLGSVYEYHAVDPSVVRANVEGTKEYARLAADVGATGVKVRPNGLQVDAGVPAEKTIEQIGLALRECGAFAADLGIEVRLEVHGKATSEPKTTRAIMDVAGHPNVKICWNSNGSDLSPDGTIGRNFALLSPFLGGTIHITDLADAKYPWRELFAHLDGMGWNGYALAEIGQESCEPIRFMRYYRALWQELRRP